MCIIFFYIALYYLLENVYFLNQEGVINVYNILLCCSVLFVRKIMYFVNQEYVC